MLYPGMQLRANGGMFGYPLVSQIAERLIRFLDAIPAPDKDALEIALAFHTTIWAVLTARIKGSGGKYGHELMEDLDAACVRYFGHLRAAIVSEQSG